jgi:hypothetical protein
LGKALLSSNFRPYHRRGLVARAAARLVCRTGDCRMQIVPTAIEEVKEIRPVRHRDPRGFFSEIFREDVLRAHGVDVPFVQENHSLSR